MVFYLGEPMNNPQPEKEPEGADRRRYRRRFVQFNVRYRFDAEGVLSDWKVSEAGNVSAGGLFMTFGENLEKGRELDVELTVPGRDRLIKAKGIIRWVKVVVPDSMVECGFEFANISAEDKAFLDAYANEAPEEEKPGGDAKPK